MQRCWGLCHARLSSAIETGCGLLRPGARPWANAARHSNACVCSGMRRKCPPAPGSAGSHGAGGRAGGDNPAIGGVRGPAWLHVGRGRLHFGTRYCFCAVGRMSLRRAGAARPPVARPRRGALPCFRAKPAALEGAVNRFSRAERAVNSTGSEHGRAQLARAMRPRRLCAGERGAAGRDPAGPVRIGKRPAPGGPLAAPGAPPAARAAGACACTLTRPRVP